MKKLTVLFLIVFGAGLVVQKASAHFKPSNLTDFVGTWDYTVQVPSGYDVKGSLIIAQKDKTPSVKFVADNSNSVEVKDVTFKNDQLKIDLNYQYNSYTMKLRKNNDGGLSGKVISSQGQKFDITAKKSDSKK